MHPSLTIYKQQSVDFINRDFELQTLTADCLFTEGPVWNKNGYYLFSDITANCIYKISEEGSKEIFLHHSGTDDPLDPDIKQDQAGSNGLAFLGDKLLICQHGSHAIALLQGQGPDVFLNSYKGRPFNSPNDIVVHSNGSIYFSDPPYGLKGGKLNPQKFQPIAGVYVAREKEIELICDRYQYPNGVCFSPGEKILYICSNKEFEKFISMYDVVSGKFMGILAEENSDGIETDSSGNVYLCSKEGLIILNNNGERLALLELPAIPSNCCWGGERGKDLFITARASVYLVRDFLS